MYFRKTSNAILHIGTEKTGSTSIQDFLYQNNDLLKQHGFLFPHRTCGLISHHRLVIYSQQSPDPALAGMNRLTLEPGPIADWKESFARKLDQEVRTFQSRCAQRVSMRKPTVIYSSEHFHSRVTEHGDIVRLRNFLGKLHDRVRIVLYARRQDHMALSAHNTAIQGGHTARFHFNEIANAGGPYYDLLALVRRWARVFGDDAITVRHYARQHLHDGDVARDFASTVGIDRIAQAKFPRRSPGILSSRPATDWRQFRFKRSNPRLCHTALETLLAFNRLQADDPRLHGRSKPTLRQPLINHLHALDDDYGTLLPARADAKRFYEDFRLDNQRLATEWMGGAGFSDDFSMYPEQMTPLPELDVEPVLTRALAELVTGHSPAEMPR